MTTTAIFAEILIIGLQVVVWLALLVASIVGTEIISIHDILDWQYLVILFVVAIAYVLGILVDRVADTVFLWVLRVMNVRREFVKRCKDREAKRGEKLYILEKVAEMFGSIKATMTGKSEEKKQPSFNTMRMQILMNSDAVAKFIDYQRSRLRVARSTTFNLFFIIVTGIVFLFTRTDLATSTIIWSALVGVILLVISMYSALRIEKAQTKNLEKAYYMITYQEGQRVAAICYRRDINGIEFLLIRTSDGLRWTFPKGHIEKGESPEEAAEREAKEEAGVTGKVRTKPFTEYSFPLQGSSPDTESEKVIAFLLEVDKKVDPQEKARDPTWCGPEKAKKKLAENREQYFADEHNRVVDTAIKEIEESRD